MNKETEISTSIEPMAMGWIPYWNMLPFYREVSRKAGAETIDFAKGHPTQVNAWLSSGKVKIAPCSSINLLANPANEIAVPMGVASNGNIQSVYLGFHHGQEEIYRLMEEKISWSREMINHSISMNGFDVRKISDFIWKITDAEPSVPLHLIPRIKLSAASGTSAALVRILYRMWYGVSAYQQMMPLENAASSMSMIDPVELVIGDEALIRKRSFSRILDLGRVWKNMTELPFVFAVWQTRGEFVNGWRRVIQEAGELAEAKMKVEPATYYPDPMPQDESGYPIDLASYWGQVNYKLGPAEFRGLSLFLSLVKDMQSSYDSESSLIKITRWQDLGIRGNIPTC